MIEQLLFDGVPVAPGHRAQPAGDGSPGPAAGFQVAGEELDISAPGLEQMELMLLALRRPQGYADQAGVAAGDGRVSGGKVGIILPW